MLVKGQNPRYGRCRRFLMKVALSKFVTYGGLFVAGLAGSVALLGSGVARAAWERADSSTCYTTLSHQIGGITNTSTAYSYTFACPYPESSALPKEDLDRLNAHGFDASSQYSVSVRACVTFWDSNGGDCGDPEYSGGSFVGNYTLRPELSVWSSSNSSDFAWISVSLQPQTSAGANTYRGFWATE
jgi:hypothetical protein